MTTQITIIGLGQIGASIGLALSEEKEHIFRCGHDPDSALMKKVEKTEALDKAFYRLTEAVKDADVVILALPVDLIKDTLSIISIELKPGTIVIDTSPLCSAAFEWAKSSLPDHRLFIPMIPAININYMDGVISDRNEGHADLFMNNSIIIAGEYGTDSRAIQTATELVNLLKGKPYFADPLEVTSILARVELLPKLNAAALIHTLMDQPGWQDGRRFASRAFLRQASVSQIFDEQEFFGISALLNKENTRQSLNLMINSLQELRELIDDEDEEGLKTYLKEAKQSYEQWVDARSSCDWDASSRPDLTPQTKMSERLLGSWIRPKNRK